MRRLAMAITVCAVGYLVGALPALEIIGVFLTRALR